MTWTEYLQYHELLVFGVSNQIPLSKKAQIKSLQAATLRNIIVAKKKLTKLKVNELNACLGYCLPDELYKS